MNLKPALRYHAKEMRIALTWYYGIVLVMSVALSLLARYLISRYGRGSVDINFSGMTGITAFFLFIAGLNSYKSELLYFLQNGLSRKTLYIALLITGVVTGLVTGTLDLLIDRLGEVTLSTMGFTITGISDLMMPVSSVPVLSKLLAAATMNGMAFLIGILLTTLFYRLNTAGKVIVPITLFALGMAWPILDYYTGGHFSSFLAGINRFAGSGIPPYLLVNGIGFAIMAGVIWLLQRRAQIKTNLS